MSRVGLTDWLIALTLIAVTACATLAWANHYHRHDRAEALARIVGQQTQIIHPERNG